MKRLVSSSLPSVREETGTVETLNNLYKINAVVKANSLWRYIRLSWRHTWKYQTVGSSGKKDSSVVTNYGCSMGQVPRIWLSQILQRKKIYDSLVVSTARIKTNRRRRNGFSALQQTTSTITTVKQASATTSTHQRLQQTHTHTRYSSVSQRERFR